jgi:tetratricopeptide (TPR) repeat protein
LKTGNYGTSRNHRRQRGVLVNMQHSRSSQTNPLLWALLMVAVALIAIVLIDVFRQFGGIANAYAHANNAKGDYSSPPPLATHGPQLHPLAILAPDQAQATSLPVPTSILVHTPTPRPTTQAAAVEPTTPPTLSPTPTPSPLPTATAAPTAMTYQPPQPAMQLSGLTHFWQTWNNCGPATLATNLSYYGSALNQADIGDVLRHYADDKNVSPDELADFAQKQGYLAQVRVNGNAQLARTLISNGIPLIIETWLEEEPNNGMGHYRLLTGYDDAAQRWTIYDSYISVDLVNGDPNNYQGIYAAYDQTEAWWEVFNHTYILAYPPDRDPLARSILGDDYDAQIMWQNAVAGNQAAVAANPSDAFAYFNLGSSLTHEGSYQAAANAFDQARALGLPWRMLWYQFGPFEAYTQVGRYQEVIDLGQKTLASADDGIEEIHYWSGQAKAALGDSAGAHDEWNHALMLNPDYLPAQQALAGTVN